MGVPEGRDTSQCFGRASNERPAVRENDEDMSPTVITDMRVRLREIVGQNRSHIEQVLSRKIYPSS